MKKVAGYIVFGILVIGVIILVRMYVPKGNQNAGTSTVNQAPAPSSTPVVASGDENVASNKISLVVNSPQDGATLNSTQVVVKGKTAPNADVFVNDQAGQADANGNFSISVTLDEGQNQIAVSANDADGNATQQNLSVTVVSF